MNYLIIGYGSMGQCHGKILTNLGTPVTFVSAQTIHDYACFNTIKEAMRNNNYDCVIIATPTYLHFNALKQLIAQGYQGVILIEKPLFSNVEILHTQMTLPTILVAYNLRFSRLINHAKHLLKNEDMISFSVFMGRYLPTRRDNSDYRQLYSSRKTHGGGALRDLSHELDFTLWLCGEWIEVSALGGHLSELEMDADDIYSIIMRCKSCPVVNIYLDYLSRVTRRDITIQTKKHTITIDLIKECLIMDGKIIKHEPDDINKTLIREHQAIIQQDYQAFCSYEQGIRVMQLIQAIERANHTRTWINNEPYVS